MSVLNQAISDSYLWTAIALRILLYLIFQNPLSDGYHVVEKKSLLEWEETYLIAVTIPEVYLASWVTTMVIQSGQSIVPYLGVDLWTLVMGLIFAFRWGPAWFRSLEATETTKTRQLAKVSGMYVSVLFGIGFGITTIIATHPNAETLQFLYQRHINFAVEVLRQFQAILGLTIPVIQPAIDHGVSIYTNNAMLAVKAGALGAIGGLLFGLGIPVILIMGVNAAMIFGVFTGLLIRNSIAIGNGLLAPPVAYLSSMGLLIAGHTFHEFMAILLVGVGAGFVTFGFVKSRFESSRSGAILTVIGFGQLAYAAVAEVTFDPLFIDFLKGYVTIEPQIVPLSLDGSWAISTGSVLLTTAVMVVITAWMTRTTVQMIEGQV